MTVARGVALGALLVVAAVVLGLILFGRGGGERYRLVFENAGQLVKGNDVQVGGRRIGNVDSITLTDDNQAAIEISVQGGFAPLHRGTTARIRATSLSGISNRYIELHPGPNNGPELSAGATLGTDATASVVDLDQLFNTLDPPTRRGLQQLVAGGATQYGDKEKQAGEVARLLNPALSSTARLVNELDRDTQAFTDFVVQTARVMTALQARKAQLTDLVTNANTTSRAIGDQSAALAATLRALPPTMRRANSTFVDLRATLGDLDPLVSASKPATRRLAPLLRDLRPLVARARPTIGDLRVAIRAPGPSNDLIDLLRTTPRLGDQARVVFPRAVRTLRRAQPVIEFVRPYIPDFTGWLRDFGVGAANYDANGHFARIEPIFNSFTLTPNGGAGVLEPRTAANRLLGFSHGNLRRCPGSQTQPRPDGGNPWLETGPAANGDCDPAEVPPGP